MSWVSVSELRRETFQATNPITTTASTGAAIRANRGHQLGERSKRRSACGSGSGADSGTGSGSIAAISRSRSSGGGATWGVASASSAVVDSASFSRAMQAEHSATCDSTRARLVRCERGQRMGGNQLVDVLVH